MDVLIESKRLVVRDWQLDDLEDFHSICSDPRVMQFVGDGQTWSRERTLRFIERAIEMSNRLGYCQWPPIHKADSTLIGYCGFVESDGRAEIGWRLAPAYWGQGLATEAARRALRYGFDVLGFRNVFATVQASNGKSNRTVRQVCRIFCATANPTEVVLAETDTGRGILGVIDGFSPKGIEDENDIKWRKNLLRQIGYKA